MLFLDRRDAGRQLAGVVAELDLDDPVVVALPRGGVPVGAAIADALGAPLEVLVARKVGAPDHREFGIGAVAEGGGSVVDEPTVAALGVSRRRYRQLVEHERREVDRQVRRYRSGRPPLALGGRDVVVVDDGLATGVTAQAALDSLRRQQPRRVVLAVPVGAPSSAAALREAGQEVVCVAEPEDFRAVGSWYRHFDQVGDDEVDELLRRVDPPG